jgi:peroxiredoxin
MVAIIVQNRLLKARVALLTKESISLQPGMAVFPFHGQLLDGRPVRVDYINQDRTLLLVMNSRCENCKLNSRLWNSLTPVAKAHGVRVIGIVLDSLAASQVYARSREFNYDLLCVPHRTFAVDYKVVLVPQTILLRRERVERVWTGIISTRDSVDISSRLSVPDSAGHITREEMSYE